MNNITRKSEKSKKSKGRSLIERARKIFTIIEYEDYFLPKTRLKEADISNDAINKWLELIVFIQSQPRIKVKKFHRNTMIEKIESKASVQFLKSFFDDTASFEVRWNSIQTYAESVMTQQKLAKSDWEE